MEITHEKKFKTESLAARKVSRLWWFNGSIVKATDRSKRASLTGVPSLQSC